MDLQQKYELCPTRPWQYKSHLLRIHLASLLSIVLFTPYVSYAQAYFDSTEVQVKPVHSSGLMDSIFLYDAKRFPDALWEAIMAYDPIGKPDTVHILRGNMDFDAEKEAVVWYQMEDWGQALCFDKKGDKWHFVGKQDLDFWHGNRSPQIESKLGALVCYYYGTGSGYSSVIMECYQIYQDSLYCVLKIVEKEGAHLIGGAFRFVAGKYKRVSATSILVRYSYDVICQYEGKHYGKSVFKHGFTVPYIWNPDRMCYLPKLPKGFPEPYDITAELQEEDFNGYIWKALHSIRKHGPKWKREALGALRQ